MDPEANRHKFPARLPGVEGEVRREGAALLLPPQPLPPQHQGVARGDGEAPHLHGVPQQLPLAVRPDRRRILFLTVFQILCHLLPSILPEEIPL